LIDGLSGIGRQVNGARMPLANDGSHVGVAAVLRSG